MEYKFEFFFLAACLLICFAPGTATSCYLNSDCDGSLSGRYCCGGECSYLSCSYTTDCVLNSDCPGAKYCCASGDCRYNLSDCPLSAGSIGGIIGGVLVVIGIIVALVACCVCASCPLHHSHRAGRVIITRQPYQNLQSATITTTSTSLPPAPTAYPPAQNIAPPPYSGPMQPAAAHGQQGFPNDQQHLGINQYPGAIKTSFTPQPPSVQQPFPGQQPVRVQQPFPGQHHNPGV